MEEKTRAVGPHLSLLCKFNLPYSWTSRVTLTQQLASVANLGARGRGEGWEPLDPLETVRLHRASDGYSAAPAPSSPHLMGRLTYFQFASLTVMAVMGVWHGFRSFC